jgi:hypothetical protein
MHSRSISIILGAYQLLFVLVAGAPAQELEPARIQRRRLERIL